MFEQVALEKEEILLELHEGRKAEEEAFKEQREMEENIKRRLLLRLMQFFQKNYKFTFCPGREMNWLDSTGGNEKQRKKLRRSITGN